MIDVSAPCFEKKIKDAHHYNSKVLHFWFSESECTAPLLVCPTQPTTWHCCFSQCVALLLRIQHFCYMPLICVTSILGSVFTLQVLPYLAKYISGWHSHMWWYLRQDVKGPIYCLLSIDVVTNIGIKFIFLLLF